MGKTYYRRRDDWVRKVQQHPGLTAIQKNIAVTYAMQFVNSGSESAWVGQDKLALTIGACTRTVRRAMKRLVELGFLAPVRSSYRSRAYRLVTEPGRERKGGLSSPARRTVEDRRSGLERPTNQYNEPEKETAMLGNEEVGKRITGLMSIDEIIKSRGFDKS